MKNAPFQWRKKRFHDPYKVITELFEYADLGFYRENLYVALVLFMEELEPIFYLIPSIVWRTPDELFTDSSDYSQNKPSWGINISKNTIPTLAEKYWFDNIMLNIKKN